MKSRRERTKPMTKREGWCRFVAVVTMAPVLAALFACSSLSTGADYDPAVDFSTYKTWAWVEDDLAAAAAGEDPRINPLVQQRIRETVERTLRTKGLRKAEPADVLVATSSGFHERQVTQGWGPAFGIFPWRYGWRPGLLYYDPFFFPRATVRSFTVETIAIDMFDAQTRRPVWHGHASKVADANPDPSEIQDVVGAILGPFPPGRTPVAAKPPSDQDPRPTY